MELREILSVFNKIAPNTYAEGWDNVGLLVGREEKQVHKIMVALDPSSAVIEQAIQENVDLLITHHPLIFSGIKSVTSGHFITNRIVQLLQKDIAYYAMHTNFDKCHMAGLVGKRLGLTDCQVLELEEDKSCGIGIAGKIEKAVSLKEFAIDVKEKMELDSIQVFGEPDREIQCIAIVPGSGKDYVKRALLLGADVLLTGDLGHHNGLDALEQGLALLDGGHYGLEKVFVPYMTEVCQKEFGLPVVAAKEEAPFWVV